MVSKKFRRNGIWVEIPKFQVYLRAILYLKIVNEKINSGYINALKASMQHLVEIGIKVKENDVKEMLSNTLPTNYNNVHSHLTHSLETMISTIIPGKKSIVQEEVEEKAIFNKKKLTWEINPWSM
jgi:hypothetical protein